MEHPEVQLLSRCAVMIDRGGEAVAAKFLGGHRLKGQDQGKELRLAVFESLRPFHLERSHSNGHGITAWTGDSNFDLV